MPKFIDDVEGQPEAQNNERFIKAELRRLKKTCPDCELTLAVRSAIGTLNPLCKKKKKSLMSVFTKIATKIVFVITWDYGQVSLR